MSSHSSSKPLPDLFKCINSRTTSLLDTGTEISVYPFVKYKDWEFPGYPCFHENAEEHLHRIKEFNSRDDDVLLCTFPKTGSHWIHEIVSMLMGHTTEYNSRILAIDHLEFFTNFDHLEEKSSPRLLHTHLPFSLIPSKHIEKRAKIVFVNRNPKDTAVSSYHFLKGLRGVPPNLTWNDCFEETTINGKLYSGWFNYTREMLTAIDDKSNNIHLVLFEDMKLNPHRELRRLAEFLKVPYDDKFIDDVAKKTSFDELKLYKTDNTVKLHPENKSTIFRKGEIGDWKNWFTIAQNAQFDALYKNEMEGFNMEFIYDN